MSFHEALWQPLTSFKISLPIGPRTQNSGYKRNCNVNYAAMYTTEIYTHTHTHTHTYLPIGMHPEWLALGQWEESTSYGP